MGIGVHCTPGMKGCGEGMRDCVRGIRVSMRPVTMRFGVRAGAQEGI